MRNDERELIEEFREVTWKYSLFALLFAASVVASYWLEGKL